MVQNIRTNARDVEVIDKARRIVRHVRPHNYSGEIRAVFDWMVGLEGSPYRLDPVDVELLQGPKSGSAGRDCDCMVVTCGSFLEALGHPCRVVIGAQRSPPPGQPPNFHHTWLEVWDRAARRWVSFDPVLHLRKPGTFAQVGDVMLHAVTRRFAVSKHGYTEGRVHGYGRTGGAKRRRGQPRGGGLAGVDGIFSKGGFLRNLVKKFDVTDSKQIGGKLLRSAAGFVPGGNAIITAADGIAKARQVVKKVTGVDPSNLIGKSPKAAVRTVARAAVAKVVPVVNQQAGNLSAALAKLPAGVRLPGIVGQAVQVAQQVQQQARPVIHAASPASSGWTSSAPAAPAPEQTFTTAPVPMGPAPAAPSPGMSGSAKAGLAAAGVLGVGGLLFALTRGKRRAA
jgi:hypothetical protein